LILNVLHDVHRGDYLHPHEGTQPKAPPMQIFLNEQSKTVWRASSQAFGNFRSETGMDAELEAKYIWCEALMSAAN